MTSVCMVQSETCQQYLASLPTELHTHRDLRKQASHSGSLTWPPFIIPNHSCRRHRQTARSTVLSQALQCEATKFTKCGDRGTRLGIGIERGVGRWNRGSGRSGWSSTSLPLGNSFLMYISKVSRAWPW